MLFNSGISPKEMVHSTNGQLHEFGPNQSLEISRYWTKNAEQLQVKVEFESLSNAIHSLLEWT
jgi:hypothetical protein